MHRHKVFIDGQAGTTGLQIHSLLAVRDDIQLLQIGDEDRKDNEKKLELLSESELVILCLPDAAAIKTVDLAADLRVKILDASTAHRVKSGWIYGLPELNATQRDLIKDAQWVANPGCYATGFLLAVAPLVEAGLIPTATALPVNAISGFSGGGRQLIEKYQQHSTGSQTTRWAIRPYALNLTHKHLPEMQAYAGLDEAPLFMPSVGDYRQGMLVEVPLFTSRFDDAHFVQRIHEVWLARYSEETCVKVHPLNAHDQLDAGFLDPEINNGTNRIELFLFATDQHCVLIARLDNLGKGAGGAAVQNMNLMLGCNELTGLTIDSLTNN